MITGSMSHLGCIDKSSSAELSEAINSMYRWYEKSSICYAYLYDCEWNPEGAGHEEAALTDDMRRQQLRAQSEETSRRSTSRVDTVIEENIRPCRWFSRGWTLQELIAPYRLKFFNQTWHFIAGRESIHELLERITGIHRDILIVQREWPHIRAKDLSDYSVAQRMFWASKRQTSRKEDEAYCLLGILGINMPLLYGEGAQAFQRLQQEIIRTSTDQSVFAWDVLGDHLQNAYLPNLLAPSPANFWGRARNIVAESHLGRRGHGSFRLTNEGIEIDLSLEAYRIKYGYSKIIAVLDCTIEESNTRVGVWLQTDTTALTQRLGVGDRLEANFATEQMSEGNCRVVELPHFDSVTDGCFTHPLLILPGSRRNLTTFLRSQQQRVEIELGSAYTIDGQVSLRSKDELVEAHPPYQWRRMDERGILSLPLGKRSFAAMDIWNWDNKRKFVIVISSTSTGIKKVLNGDWASRNDNELFCYWIVPSLEPSRGSNMRISVERHQEYLRALCDRAASFESKDYYERTTKRQDSSKRLRLPSGEFVYASFKGLEFDASGPCYTCALDFKFESQDNSETSVAEQEYFNIEHIQQSLLLPRIFVSSNTGYEAG